MKKNNPLKILGNHIKERTESDEKEGIVGFVVFDTAKRIFVAFRGEHTVYTGNVEEARIASNRSEASGTMASLDDFYDVKIVPLIHNELFGLSPAPGTLNDIRE